MSFDTAHPQDRPNVDGKLNGRIDLTSLSRIDLEGRFILGTDYPGSPNIQAGLAHLPIFTTVGGSAGFGQRFNRFDVTFKGGVDRTVFLPALAHRHDKIYGRARHLRRRHSQGLSLRGFGCALLPVDPRISPQRRVPV